MFLPLLLSCLPIALHCTGVDDPAFPGCPGRDHCSDMKPEARQNFLSRNCECDSDCLDFGDCCEDHPRDDARQRKNDRRMRCVGLGLDNMGAYMVADCPAGTEPDLREKCEHSLNDPISVFRPDGPTYTNPYCALCNGHNVQSMHNPFYRAVCNPRVPGRSRSVAFLSPSDEEDGWEVLYESSSHTCYLYFNFSTVAPHARVLPIDVGRLFDIGVSELARFKHSDLSDEHSRVRRWIGYYGLRLCRPNLVSECPPGSDERVREACTAGYTAMVHSWEGGRQVAYRNHHCALCNGVDLRSVVCDPSELEKGRRKEFSFAHLFDVFGKGDVGMRFHQECTKDQKYDPTSKTCRNLVCAIPGYVKRNGRCVKKRS